MWSSSLKNTRQLCVGCSFWEKCTSRLDDVHLVTKIQIQVLIHINTKIQVCDLVSWSCVWVAVFWRSVSSGWSASCLLPLGGHWTLQFSLKISHEHLKYHWSTPQFPWACIYISLHSLSLWLIVSKPHNSLLTLFEMLFSAIMKCCFRSGKRNVGFVHVMQRAHVKAPTNKQVHHFESVVRSSKCNVLVHGTKDGILLRN